MMVRAGASSAGARMRYAACSSGVVAAFAQSRSASRQARKARPAARQRAVDQRRTQRLCSPFGQRLPSLHLGLGRRADPQRGRAAEQLADAPPQLLPGLAAWTRPCRRAEIRTGAAVHGADRRCRPTRPGNPCRPRPAGPGPGPSGPQPDRIAGVEVEGARAGQHGHVLQVVVRSCPARSRRRAAAIFILPALLLSDEDGSWLRARYCARR